MGQGCGHSQHQPLLALGAVCVCVRTEAQALVFSGLAPKESLIFPFALKIRNSNIRAF